MSDQIQGSSLRDTQSGTAIGHGRFRKKPVVIDAFRWTGDHDQTDDPDWIVDAIRAGRVGFNAPGSSGVTMIVETAEGLMQARPGDWIIRGIKGEIYPCMPDVFALTYEPVSQPTPPLDDRAGGDEGSQSRSETQQAKSEAALWKAHDEIEAERNRP